MNSIERMKRICVALGMCGSAAIEKHEFWQPYYGQLYYPSHKLLDKCDALAGIDTTGGRADGLRGSAAHMFRTPGCYNQVGRRLALLEQHLFERKHEPCDHHLNIMARDGLLPRTAEEERAAIVEWLRNPGIALRAPTMRRDEDDPDYCPTCTGDMLFRKSLALAIEHGGHLK